MARLTSLYIAPLNPEAAPDMHHVRRVLSDLGVIGEPFDHATFLAGAGFSRHVVYAGCSPYLVLQPPRDGSLAFCHVALHGPFGRPHLVTGPNTVKPRCPVCRARIDDWRAQLARWQGGQSLAVCGSCGSTAPPGRLDWRGHAISGRVLIELRNVFPGEASPSDRLMHTLREHTGEDWRYAWAASLID
jgi:hypothetical protein